MNSTPKWGSLFGSLTFLLFTFIGSNTAQGKTPVTSHLNQVNSNEETISVAASLNELLVSQSGPGSSQTAPCQNFQYFYINNGPEIQGSSLYGVSLSGNDAQMTLLTTLPYDAHIAYDGSNNLLYVVRALGSYIDVYDVGSGSVIDSARIYLNSEMTGLYSAVYNPEDGMLYIGSGTNDEIYAVDPTSGDVTPYASANVSGGDLALVNGNLYLARRAPQHSGLYMVTDGSITPISYLPPMVNGLAATADGNLIVTAYGASQIYEVDTAGNSLGTYDSWLDGNVFTASNGDLASGCLGSGGSTQGCTNFLYYYVADNTPNVSQGTVYSGVINGNEFDLTELFSANFSCHMALNNNTGDIYLVASSGNELRTYDNTGSLLNTVNISGMGSITAAVWNPADSMVYLGSSSQDKIYAVDPMTGANTLYASNVPVVGGDLVIGDDGTMYLIKRIDNGPSKLYMISGGIATYMADVATAVNGAGWTANGGFIMARGGNSNAFYTYDVTGGNEMMLSAMLNGQAFPVVDGDMASGCVSPGGEIQNPPVGNCYASCLYGDGYVQGTEYDGSPLPSDRTDATKALGVPQNDDSQGSFVTLGYGGSIELCFDGAVLNGPGPDLQIVETSFGNPSCNTYHEVADVSVSQDGTSWYSVGSVCLDGSVDISDAQTDLTLAYINYVKITNDDQQTATPDGYDLDGVSVLSNGCGNDNGVPPVEQTSVNSQSNTSSPSSIDFSSWPNPMQGMSEYNFSVTHSGRVQVDVFNMAGVKVKTLYNGEVLGGQTYHMNFNASDLRSGLYLFRIRTSDDVKLEKVLVSH